MCRQVCSSVSWPIQMRPARTGWRGRARGLSVASFGLELTSVVRVNGIPQSTQNPYDETTTFYGATLRLSGLAASGLAVVNTVLPDLTVVSQPLEPGSFELWSGGAEAERKLLLHGVLRNMVIVGLQGGDTAGVQSTVIQLDRGAIFDSLVEVMAARQNIFWTDNPLWSNSSASWSALNLDSPGGLVVDSTGNIASFEGDLTGILRDEPALCAGAARAGRAGHPGFVHRGVIESRGASEAYPSSIHEPWCAEAHPTKEHQEGPLSLEWADVPIRRCGWCAEAHPTPIKAPRRMHIDRTERAAVGFIVEDCYVKDFTLAHRQRAEPARTHREVR